MRFRQSTHSVISRRRSAGADADERKEFGLRDGRQLDAETLVEHRQMNRVEFLEQTDHILLLVARGPAAGFHEVHHRRLGEKAEKRLGIGEPAGHPDELNVLVAEAGRILDADAHIDIQDFRGFEQFVVDDAQPADALDPGVHDEVRGGLAALGVDVVHMIVESDLVPLLGHLQQVVPPELAADDAGLAGGGHAEIVGQLQLAPGVAVGPDQTFHDLQEHPGRILGHGAFGRIDHFQAQGAQGVQAVLHPADFKGAQKLRHRICRAQALGLRHFLDAVGVKIGEIQPVRILRAAQNVVDDLDQLVVLPIEKITWYFRIDVHCRRMMLTCVTFNSIIT